MPEPDRPGSADAAGVPRAHLLDRTFHRGTLAELRHEVEAHTERNGLTDLARYRFIVAVNELTTNAVQHGGGTGRLELWRSGNELHCRVTDHGPGLPAARHGHPARPPADAVSGRGLWLVRQGCTTLTVQRRDTGTSITVTLRTDEPLR
jgi:anti-sigma regulatory factor (Ser/Thr protein kinase)